MIFLPQFFPDRGFLSRQTRPVAPGLVGLYAGANAEVTISMFAGICIGELDSALLKAPVWCADVIPFVFRSLLY
jgi:hypothetical protein